MSEGFVYVLNNWAIPGLVKVGKTRRDSKLRAREISRPTGVPGAYNVIYEIFSSDCDRLERLTHDALSEFRSEGEFFRVSAETAIFEIEKIVMPAESYSDRFVAVRILEALEEKYSGWLREKISDVRIVQCEERVWLETTEEELIADYLVDQKIHRSDLAFITSGVGLNEAPFFSPINAVSSNAKKFIEEFDPYSIIHTTNLFNDQACRAIDANPLYNPHLETANQS